MRRETRSLLGRCGGELLKLLTDAKGRRLDDVVQSLARLVPRARQVRLTVEETTTIWPNPPPPPADEEWLTVAFSSGKNRGQVEMSLPPDALDEERPGLELIASLLDSVLFPAQPPGWENLVIVAEAAGALVHDVNNHLNSVVMQSAALGLKVPPELRERTASIRQEAVRAAQKLRPVQEVPPWPAAPGEKVDLRQAVQQALAQNDGVVRIDVQLCAPDQISRFPGSFRAVKRLIELLTGLALQWVPAPGRVSLSVIPPAGLDLLLPGVIAEQGLPEAPGAGIHELQREAARWLIRQTGGGLTVLQQEDRCVLNLQWPN